MRRNRGKTKKQPLVAAHEDHGSGEEEKMSAKRRGRPLKISKSETKAKEEAKNFDDRENMNGVLSENTNTESGVESGEKGEELQRSMEIMELLRMKVTVRLKSMNNNAGSGYSTPEVAMYAQYTIKRDVYSFGVSMLELLSGRKSFDSSRPRSEQSLFRRATLQLHNIDALAKMVDLALNGLYPVKSLSRMLLKSPLHSHKGWSKRKEAVSFSPQHRASCFCF
ncbi:hypothetical protein AgCh_033238 [Apium graveolens]